MCMVKTTPQAVGLFKQITLWQIIRIKIALIMMVGGAQMNMHKEKWINAYNFSLKVTT